MLKNITNHWREIFNPVTQSNKIKGSGKRNHKLPYTYQMPRKPRIEIAD